MKNFTKIIKIIIYHGKLSFFKQKLFDSLTIKYIPTV